MRRFKELDSLRGLAALSVLFSHFMSVLPIFQTSTMHEKGVAPYITLVKYTPLHIFWAGGEAVVLFFILSGFVLSLPFYSNRNPTYLSFIVRRIFRIYPVYFLAIAIAMILDHFFSRHGIQELSSWFNSVWNVRITMDLFLNHIFLVGSFDNGSIDPVIWSLVHEMRISVVFPLLMIGVSKFNWRTSLGLGMLCSLLGQVLHKVYGNNNDYLLTLHFIIMFITGALLAKHREYIAELFFRLSRLRKALFLFCGILCYTFNWLTSWIPDSGHFKTLSHLCSLDFVSYWFITVGASVFIVTAIGSTTASFVLNKRPMTFLGDISYSLYLFHTVILLTVVNSLHGYVSMWTMWIISFFMSVAVATLVNKAVEQPFVRLGRKIAPNVNHNVNLSV